MKKIHLIFLVLAVIFSHCTPKVAPVGSTEVDKKEPVEAVAAADFRAQPPPPGPAPKVEIDTYESFKLDNGVQVIVVENDKIPKVSLQLTIDLPPVAEGDKAGAANIAGELLSKGTSTRSKADIDEAIDFIGATLSTSPSGLFASSLTKHFDQLLGIVSDVLLNPAFPKEEFEKIKKQYLSSLAAAQNDPDVIASNVAAVLRFGKDHPYGEIETEASINKITLEDIQTFYQNYFNPEIAYLVLVGDISKSEAEPLMKKYFGSWNSKGTVPQKSYKKPKPPQGNTVNFVNKEGAVQSVITVTYPIELKPGGEDAIEANVMNYWLGGAGFFKSRLLTNIREDKGYTYTISSTLDSDKEIGHFTIQTGVRNEVTDSALVEILKEMEKLRTEAVSEENLELLKNVVSGNFARALERPQTVARFALNTFLYGLPEDYYANYLKKVSAIGADDIREMANKYLHPDRAHILVVGNRDEVVQKLGNFSATGKVNQLDPFGNPVEVKATVAVDKTPESVLEEYLKAVGGMEGIKKIKDAKMEQSMSFQGMKIGMSTFIKAPDKYAQEQSLNGSVMGRTVINGDKGVITQMGQKQQLEGEMLDAVKLQSQLFPESKMLDQEKQFQLQLVGMEPVNGKEAYKVIATSESGVKTTMFFEKATGLKVKMVSPTPQGNVTIDLSDYKEIGGIKFPHKATVSGMLPVPVEVITESIQLNTGLNDDVFALE